MRIGYLVNTYPVPSSTFIRREIQALEEQGVQISRYAIRRWGDQLIDERDKAEQDRTQYILSGQSLRLISGLFSELVLNPIGMARAFGAWSRLVGNARGGLIRHAAYFLEAISLKRLTKADRIDHVHVHFSTNATAVALLCNRLGGPGYSFTAHGPDEFIDWGPSSLKMKIAGARFVVAISHYCVVQLARAAGMQEWDKVHIVRCGLDIDEFEVSDAGFGPDAPFVCVGRLCPQKAQVLIVEAVATVAALHPNVKVQLIGDGESRPDVEAAIARHGLENNVELLGWRDNHEVRCLLGKARALLLPSFAEGLPVVIMEALALGRPAISTYIAGIPELVDPDCGWIIPAGSSEHIAKTMIEAIEAEPDKLAALGQEGRRRTVALHDIRKNARVLEDLFRKVEADTSP